MLNDECLADVVETQNFASLRVGERYYVPWQVCRVSLFPLLLRVRGSVLAGVRHFFLAVHLFPLCNDKGGSVNE